MAVCMRYRGCILNSHYYHCDPYDSDFDNGYGDQMLSVLSLCVMSYDHEMSRYLYVDTV